MKILWKVLAWIGLSIISLGVLIMLVSLVYRFFSPTPQPPGELVDIGGFKLHIHSTGEKNNKPTLVIEAGAGAPGEYYHWLSEGLKDSIRVVRYDRAGIGYSELGSTTSDPETAARELHKLLELAGESPPYIMAGHSYGGHYIRIFTQLYGDEVAAMVFLDSSHPEAGKRLHLPKEPWFVTPMYHIGAALGDLGVLHVYDRNFGPILWAPGLPKEITHRMKNYTYNGKFIKGYLKRDGNKKWARRLKKLTLEASDFGSLPINVFSGTHQNDEALIRFGVDPAHFRAERVKMQEEIADLSSDSELFFLDAGHVTIFTIKEHADFICEKILQLLGELASE